MVWSFGGSKIDVQVCVQIGEVEEVIQRNLDSESCPRKTAIMYFVLLQRRHYLVVMELHALNCI